MKIARELLAWFDRSGRKHLPWQRDRTPYRVWVSEIMLQQTQVATVIAYYERFVQRFPDVQALASAPIDEVLHLWTGLGYYARARNLHRAAQTIVAGLNGEFPSTLEAMQSLPGVGRSTAGAILALARSQRHPILDGNVKRVLTRYFGIDGFPGEQKIERELWRLADECTPAERVADYTQAIMDLGATVCVRSRPLCAVCPLQEHCVARIEHRQSSLPTPRPKKVRPQRVAYAVVAVDERGAVLLERRPATGLWGGLWTFAELDGADAREHCRRVLGCEIEAARRLAPLEHGFTHFRLRAQPLLCAVHARAPRAETAGRIWLDAAEAVRAAVPVPVRKVLQGLARVGESRERPGRATARSS